MLQSLQNRSHISKKKEMIIQIDHWINKTEWRVLFLIPDFVYVWWKGVPITAVHHPIELLGLTSTRKTNDTKKNVRWLGIFVQMKRIVYLLFRLHISFKQILSDPAFIGASPHRHTGHMNDIRHGRSSLFCACLFFSMVRISNWNDTLGRLHTPTHIMLPMI